MSSLRIGVIGGHEAAAFAAAVEASSEAELAGQASTDGEAWRDLVERGDVQALAVFAPPDHATDMCDAALQLGRHVICSTPPARTIEEIIRIRRAESASGGKIARFIMPFRQHASVKSALSLAASGVLGRLMTLRGTYGSSERGPGALLRYGFHMIDLMQGFCGPFDDVQGMLAHSPGEGDGSEQNAFAILRTNKGVIAQLHASTTSWRHTFRLEAGFERGYIWLDGLKTAEADFAPEMLIVGRVQKDPDGRDLPNPDEEIHQMDEAPTAADELAAFLDATRGGTGGWLGTTKQMFEALNAVQRVYAVDHSWELET